MHQLSCILSYFFCICLALHAINYANHNVNAKTIINSWLEGAVYEGADNVKQVTTFKEMIWNSLTMLRLTSNHTVKTLYYHPDWNSAYVYNRKYHFEVYCQIFYYEI